MAVLRDRCRLRSAALWRQPRLGGGAGGGTASAVSVTVRARFRPRASNSNGILAQSIGGGGGNGGFAASGSLGLASGAVSFGGDGAGGGDGAAVTVTDDGGGQSMSAGSFGAGWNIVTEGAFQRHRCPEHRRRRRQWRVLGLPSASAIAGAGVSLGGTASGGGAGGDVDVTSGDSSYVNNILTEGDPRRHSGAIDRRRRRQWRISGSLAISGGAALGVSVGGDGGTASNAGAVTVSSLGDLVTAGANSQGILAQSIGGGGGNGGFGVAGSGTDGGALALGLGGTGGGGGTASDVSVTESGSIITGGNNADGILAQIDRGRRWRWWLFGHRQPGCCLRQRYRWRQRRGWPGCRCGERHGRWRWRQRLERRDHGR